MGKKPCLSLGMTLYNAEEFLEETFDSLLSQTFDDFEIVISDNASTDRTEAICQSYMTKDSRIRYVRNQTNLGAAFNYNRTFELSSGKYFKWAASDDLCEPDYFAKCVAVLDAHPDVVLCYPKTTIINENGKFVRHYHDGLDLRSQNVSDRFRWAVQRTLECNAIFGIIRSDVLRQTPKIGNYTASDRVLLVELSLSGQFYEIPEYLFFRREHAKASSSNKTQKSQQEFFDPKTKGKVSMLYWNLFVQHLAVVHRAGVKFSVKVLLVRSVLRGLITQRWYLLREPFDALRQVSRNFINKT